MDVMSSTDLRRRSRHWPETWRPTGSPGTRLPIRAVVRAARAHGVSPVLVDILADPGQPEVARLRAFGTSPPLWPVGRPDRCATARPAHAPPPDRRPPHPSVCCRPEWSARATPRVRTLGSSPARSRGVGRPCGNLAGMHLSLLLDMAADAMGDRRAVTAPEGELTYAELRDAAVAAAGALGGTGRAHGPARRQLARRPDRPARRVAGRHAVHAAQLPPRRRRPAAHRRAGRAGGRHRRRRHGQSARRRRRPRRDHHQRAARRGVDAASTRPIPEPDDVLVMLFTSGTTGEPKAALLRHRHVTSYVFSTLDFASADEEEAALVSVPPYHIAGISSITSSMYVGRRVVYLPAFTPEAWVAAAAAEAITHAMVVPTMLGRVLDVIEATRRAAAGPAPPVLRRRADARRGHRAGAAAAAGRRLRQRLRADRDELDDLRAGPRRPPCRAWPATTPPCAAASARSAGRTARSRCRSATRSGSRSQPGESGEIWVRGDQVSGEYAGKADDRDRRLVPDPRRRMDRRGRVPLRRRAASTT